MRLVTNLLDSATNIIVGEMFYFGPQSDVYCLGMIKWPYKEISWIQLIQ